MTDDECIALAYLHCDEPVIEYRGNVTSVWYVKDDRDHCGWLSGYWMHETQAEACRAYCKIHGLLQEVTNAEDDHSL